MIAQRFGDGKKQVLQRIDTSGITVTNYKSDASSTRRLLTLQSCPSGEWGVPRCAAVLSESFCRIALLLHGPWLP